MIFSRRKIQANEKLWQMLSTDSFFFKRLLNFNWHLNWNSTNIKSDTSKSAFKVPLTLLEMNWVTPFCSIVSQRTLKIIFPGAFDTVLREEETRWVQELSVRDRWCVPRPAYSIPDNVCIVPSAHFSSDRRYHPSAWETAGLWDFWQKHFASHTAPMIQMFVPAEIMTQEFHLGTMCQKNKLPG